VSERFDWWPIAILGVLVAVYVIYRKANSPLSQEQASNALRNAGATVRTTQYGTFAQTQGIFGGENATFKIPEDGWPLNWFQKSLIGLDRIVPGTWLTKAVLT